MYQKYTGIILKKYPFGEADELLTVYTREAGKLRCKAAAVRKNTSKMAGHVQSLNEIEFELAGRGQLPVMISVRAHAINSYLRQNLRKFAYALVGIETLYRLTPDREASEGMYGLLRNFLKDLGETMEENLAVRKFQLNLLAAAGFKIPNLTLSPSPISERAGGEVSNIVLTAKIEKEIDAFIEGILEREVKSAKFLKEVSN